MLQYQQSGNSISNADPQNFQTSGNLVSDLQQRQGIQASTRGTSANLSDPRDVKAWADSRANDEQLGQLEQQARYDPWGYYRPAAAGKLATFAQGQDPSNFYRSKLQQMSMGEFSPDDPSYQWRFDQGQQAVERSLGARGLLNSGNAGIELQEYGQGAASQEYGAQFQRMLQALGGVESQYTSQFSRLAEMAGINLNPQGIGALNNQTMANQITAKNNANNYDIENQKLGMYSAYNSGIGDTLRSENTGLTGSPSGDVASAFGRY